MKKYLIVITMLLALGMNTQAASQKHRHSPRTEQVDSTKNKQDAIEAFSDTTSSDSAADAEDDRYISSSQRRVVYQSDDAEFLREIFGGSVGVLGSMVAISAIIFVLLFILAPIIILIIVFYFVNKNRRERYKLAQMAIENGQPIPDEVLKDAKDDWDRTDYQTGVRQMFTGVGLAIFLGIVIGEIGVGIGALIFFIGLGKWYINRNPGPNGNDPLNNNRSDQFNNNNNNPSNI